MWLPPEKDVSDDRLLNGEEPHQVTLPRGIPAKPRRRSARHSAGSLGWSAMAFLEPGSPADHAAAARAELESTLGRRRRGRRPGARAGST